MTLYTPDDRGPNATDDAGPKMADLEGKLLLVKVVEVRRDVADKFNPGTTKTAVFGDCWLLLEDTTLELGRVAFWQQVLAERLAEAGEGNWYAGRVERPNRAFIFDLNDGDQARAEKTFAELTSPNGTVPAAPQPAPTQEAF